MLAALKARAAETGLRRLIVSVRPNLVPGGIAPVYASVARDHAVYVEPKVWFEHPMDQ
jgi:hypothetical protein